MTLERAKVPRRYQKRIKVTQTVWGMNFKWEKKPEKIRRTKFMHTLFVPA